MILQRSPGETWLGAAMRFASLEGVAHTQVYATMSRLESEGYSERRAAYLVLAELGIVVGVE